MANDKTNPDSASGGVSGRSILINLTIGAMLAGGVGFALYRLRDHVSRNMAYSAAPPRIVLKNIPIWMSDDLARSIANGARPRALGSMMDQQVLKEIVATLRANPWVRNVRQVKRVFGESAGDTLQIDCEYRAPIALAASGDEYILIDGEGVRLPERYPAGAMPPVVHTASGRTNIRIIDGVAAAPPAKAGEKWHGEDLAAGLDMVKLLYGRDFADEIERVNVANFHNRRSANDAQITLITKHFSEIRWGEPARQDFHAELAPARKLERMAMLHRRLGRVDGRHSWIDIRMDQITYPADEKAVVQAGAAGGGR